MRAFQRTARGTRPCLAGCPRTPRGLLQSSARRVPNTRHIRGSPSRVRWRCRLRGTVDADAACRWWGHSCQNLARLRGCRASEGCDGVFQCAGELQAIHGLGCVEIHHLSVISELEPIQAIADEGGRKEIVFSKLCVELRPRSLVVMNAIRHEAPKA